MLEKWKCREYRSLKVSWKCRNCGEIRKYRKHRTNKHRNDLIFHFFKGWCVLIGIALMRSHVGHEFWSFMHLMLEHFTHFTVRGRFTVGIGRTVYRFGKKLDEKLKPVNPCESSEIPEIHGKLITVHGLSKFVKKCLWVDRRFRYTSHCSHLVQPTSLFHVVLDGVSLRRIKPTWLFFSASALPGPSVWPLSRRFQEGLRRS